MFAAHTVGSELEPQKNSHKKHVMALAECTTSVVPVLTQNGDGIVWGLLAARSVRDPVSRE